MQLNRCIHNHKDQSIETSELCSANRQTNPLLAEWNTPYQTPPFDKIKTEHYKPAFHVAIKEAKEEIRRIKDTKSLPNFDNTIAAMDRAGEKLSRISSLFYNMLSCHTSTELQAIAQDVSPKLTEYSNDIYLNETLFTRVKSIYERQNQYSLTKEQETVLQKTYRQFIKNGANLSEEDKIKFRTMVTELSTLTLTFGNHVLAATNNFSKNITDKKLLSGIPVCDLEIAQEKAKSKCLKGWLFDLSMPCYNAVMKYADNCELRREFYLQYSRRAYGGQYDNTEIIKQIIVRRNALAHLLGYDTYVNYALQDRMAENGENVYQLLDKLLAYFLPAARAEMTELAAFAKNSGWKEPMQRWDFAYYSEKQKQTLFQLNDEMIKPYFTLENVTEGIFELATKLYDLSFEETHSITTYHPDVKVYKVFRKEKLTAILYLDFHPRNSKRDGAWMTSFREQYKDKDNNNIIPIISLVMNFTPATQTHPSLLTFYELRTFLHEFGHALHGMLSNVTYKMVSGTNVPRDFVELPSQMNENWAVEWDFLRKFAFHYQTNEPIPNNLATILRQFDNFQAGYHSCRQLSFGYLDMMWHTIHPDSINQILPLERTVMDKIELLPVVPDTCMSTSFSHIFSGGYAAGYYGYKWAEVLDADAFAIFQERGILSREAAESFYENILSKGGSQPPMELYKAFRGREPEVDALLIRSGIKPLIHKKNI